MRDEPFEESSPERLLRALVVRERRLARRGDELRKTIVGQRIGKGFRIVDFRQRQMDLEDVFMTVTKGEVQ